MNGASTSWHALLACGLLSWAGPANADAVTAVWREHRVSLSYRSVSTRYSCADLVSRIAAILHAVGVRAGITVDTNCSDLASVQLLHVTLQHPVEATAENVRAVTTFDSARRLLAEVRGESLPTAADIATFPAAWRTVPLTRLRRTRLSNADCQLLRALKDQVFPQLDVRIPHGSFRCQHDGASAIQPSVVAEALIANTTLPTTVGSYRRRVRE